MKITMATMMATMRIKLEELALQFAAGVANAMTKGRKGLCVMSQENLKRFINVDKLPLIVQ